MVSGPRDAVRQTLWLPTTEDSVWILLPFRVREQGLTRRQADRLARSYRKRDYLARVCRLRGAFAVATYWPRRFAPRECDL